MRDRRSFAVSSPVCILGEGVVESGCSGYKGDRRGSGGVEDRGYLRVHGIS